jgi:hypothetical protein
MAEKGWGMYDGETYETTLENFAKKHEMTTSEFINGRTSRAAFATGGNVDEVSSVPDWAQGAQQRNTGGEVSFEWGGGSDNYRVKRKNGGTVEFGNKIKSFLNGMKAD